MALQQSKAVFRFIEHTKTKTRFELNGSVAERRFATRARHTQSKAVVLTRRTNQNKTKAVELICVGFETFILIRKFMILLSVHC